MKAETTQRPRSRGTGMAWTDTARTGPRFGGSVVALERELRRRLRGEVRFDGGSRALYATDASNYRQVPIGVVIPRDTDDVMEAVAVCRRHGAPITHRGAGTSLAGQTCNVAVIIDHSKYLDRIVDVDPARKIAVVEPGVRRDQLAHRCEREHGLTFAPDTSTHAFATFGGMIGNNACGVHSVMAGRTDENVEAMEVLTYDGCRLRVGPTSEAELERIIRAGGRKGDIYRRLRDLRGRYADVIRARTPDLPRLVSGYYLYYLLPEHGFNVARALVGTEGTCVTILEATLRLVPSPPCRALLVLGYPDVYAAGDHIPEIHECEPIGLEGFDDLLVRYMHEKKLHLDTLRLLPDGKGFLFAEFGGETEAEAVGRARRCAEMLERRHGPDAPRAMVVEDHATQRKLWEVREAGLAATAHLEGETWPGWEDSAVPPERFGQFWGLVRSALAPGGHGEVREALGQQQEVRRGPQGIGEADREHVVDAARSAPREDDVEPGDHRRPEKPREEDEGCQDSAAHHR